MDNIRIKNYRCFKDTDYVSIKPITVLLGANSSKESYNKASNGIKPIVKGYGSGLLSLSLNKSEQIKKQLSSKNDLYSINSDDLNGFQKKEWTTIGRELLSWTCCLKDNVF